MGTRSSSATGRVLAVLLAAVLLAGPGVLLAACGEGTGTPQTPGGSMSTEPTGGSTGNRSYPPGLPLSPPASSKSYPSGDTTMTGVVEAGVEYGCLVLNANGVTYTLVGGDRAVLRPGARVTVRGRPNPSLVTTCQQGVAFEVAEAHPA